MHRHADRPRTLVKALLLALAAVLALPAAAAAAPTGWIVVVEEGADPLAVAGDAGAEVEHSYEAAINGFTARLDGPQVAQLRRDGRVESVMPDRAARRAAAGPPHEVTQLYSWGQERMGMLDSRTVRLDNVDQPLDADVAVFDTGIDPDHPDLRVAGGVDCAGAGTWRDAEGHGTLVSGIAAGIDNRFGIVGVAPGARAWSVRVEDERGRIDESSLLCGIEWLLAGEGQGIRVVNMSLGIKSSVTGPCGVMAGGKGGGRVKDPLHAAICRAHEAGITVVAAAGNDAYDAERQLPAAYPEVIAVSAMTETDGTFGAGGPPPTCLPGEVDDHLASFSNFGSVIDFTAVGVCVPSTLPGGRYANVNGTSFSAPHVAGAAALVLARSPLLSPAGVKAELLAAAAHDPLPGDPDGIAEPFAAVGSL